jgi:GNAT superfamily N-acetyltransferase
MRIRECTPADHAAVRELVNAILDEFGFAAEQVGSLEEDLAAIAERYGGQGGFWVAEVDGEVVGTVAVRPKNERICEVKRLYLRADKRGSGLGQALYEHAEAFARAAGYHGIWLDSSRRFDKAHRLYERNGFVLVEYVDNEWQDAVFEKSFVDAT